MSNQELLELQRTLVSLEIMNLEERLVGLREARRAIEQAREVLG